MYKIAVPVNTLHAVRSSKEALIANLRSLDAERVFLTLGAKGAACFPQKLAILREYTAFLKENGYEVGAWIQAFGVQGEHTHTGIHLANGKVVKSEVCPSDPTYSTWLSERVKVIAACGVDMIMLDDDFRFGHHLDGFGCLCPNHLAKISEILGEPVTLEFMQEKLLSGGGNRYRDAFLAANGFWLEETARRLRQAVDSVNPEVRVGACACMTSWDMDGTSPERISRILAGNTKPFYRFIGAPYWAVLRNCGQRLQDTVELERMESAWRQDSEIEVFGEGDAYPRPRWQVPAAYLEGFDTALRAANCTDGILKYALDYFSSVNYEDGYVRRHIENKALYQKIQEHFAPKTACGIRVYEMPKKYAEMEIPSAIANTCAVQDGFFSPAAEMLACCGIPTVYEGEGLCGIAFGENARAVPSEVLKRGMILDIDAARILQQRGIDTGIAAFGETVSAEEEFFLGENEYVGIPDEPGKIRYCCTKLQPGADVQSTISTDVGDFPASYYYRNEQGQPFLVFTFAAYFASERLWRQYTRARQLATAVERLSGTPLPVRITAEAPDLYMICKENDHAISVGLWNFSLDAVPQQELLLAKAYTDAEFLNCTGRLNGKKIILPEMQPYSFAGFTMKKPTSER